MKKHVLEQQIRTAVEHAAPNQLDSILSSCDQIQNTAGAPVQEQKKGAIIHMSEVKNSKARRRSGSRDRAGADTGYDKYTGS